MENIFNASPDNIWNYKQNHPELVIKDLKHYGISSEIQNIVRQSMLCRGINKWLKVRRDLIAYKKQIKHSIIMLQHYINQYKQKLNENYCSIDDLLNGTKTKKKYFNYKSIEHTYIILKDRLKILQTIRSDLKNMCMTDRWQIWENSKLQNMNTINASDNLKLKNVKFIDIIFSN